MAVEIINRSGIASPEKELHSLLNFSIKELGLHQECELNLLLVEESEMSELHLKWMGEPGPTDVLSFPMDEVTPGWPEEAILGDIVLCPTIAASQAGSAGHSATHEMAILSVHGLLHILGYDHATKLEESEMFALQESLVAKWSQ